MKRSWRAAVPVVLLCLAFVPAQAQIPEEFKNLQVLPEDIDPQELVGVMRNFAGALGVRCWYCHVGEEGKPLSTFDFATDEKDKKKVAREMMRMVTDINASIAKIDTGHATKIEVQCATCHRGVEEPRQLLDILTASYADGGLDAAVDEYKELRKQHYGGYAYDFRPGPLNMFAEHLARQGKTADAVAVQEMNVDLHPDAPFVHAALGQAYEKNGDKQKAIEAYEKELAKNPQNRWVKQQIDRLKG